MLTRKQIKILNIFAGSEFKEFSFKELKELCRENSTSIIQNAIKAFLKEGLIKERKIGTSKLYSLNHENDKVYTYLELFIKEKLPKQVKYSLQLIKESIDKHTCFYSLVVFGSYASGKQSKTSDLDVAVFIDKEKDKKRMEASLKSAGLKSFLKIDGHVITNKEFLEMLKIESENLGKQIARKHLIIYNPLIFYSLLKEGIKNGFRI
jgi:predicted nucleotidyltransferase